MREREGYGVGTILLAVLGGAAVGATIALLTAPSSGEDTRRQINDVLQRRRDQFSRIPPALRGAYDSATEAARQAFTESYRSQGG